MIQPRDGPRLSYSTGLRRAFNLGALVVALLPIPVALLQLLPAYRIQTRFLAFYAPLVCLLTLAYLFYVRDALARMMFAHLLDPLPPLPTHYHERRHIRMRRRLMRLRRGFLAVLPGILLLGSFACMIRYVKRLDQSVARASAFDRHLRAPEDVGLLTVPGRKPGQLPAATADSAAGGGIRQRVLNTQSTDHIPYFAELTALYIGSFLGALVALVLMGLREYAKDALGLSEQDVVLGRVLMEPE